MQENNDKPVSPFISEESQEKAKAAIDSAFRAVTEHIGRMADNIAAFNKERQEMQGRMNRGSRRTNGRIV
ncbi:MAG: hypothetical protein ACR2LC_05950 [Pyrinomonadaceae bacterium]